jgi:hypothetical protein
MNSWVMVRLGYPLKDRKDYRTGWTGQLVIMMKYSLGGHSPSRVFLSTLFCNHYAQLHRFSPFQSTLFTHHKKSGILQSFKSPFLDCLDLCLHNVEYCNFGNNNPMSIYIWLITYSNTKKKPLIFLILSPFRGV